MASRPSVSPYVMLMDCDHVGWVGILGKYGFMVS